MLPVNLPLCREKRKELYIRLLLRLICAVVLCWILLKHFDVLFLVLLIFLLPYYLAKTLNRAVNFLSGKFSVSRRVLSFACVSVLIAVLAVILYVAVRQISNEILQLADNWDEMQASLTSALSTISQAISSVAGQEDAELQTRLIELTQSGLQWLNERIEAWTPPVAEQAGNLLDITMTIFLSCVLFFVACFYFTAEYPEMKKRMQLHIPAFLRGRSASVRRAVGIAAGGYLKAQVILSGFVMIFMLIAFILKGQKYKILLSVLIAIVDFIPLFGSGTVLVPWGIAALLSGNFSQALFLFVMAAFLFVFRKVAEPKVMSNQTGLSTLVSLICIYIGMKMDGIFGMIVAPVVCLALRNLYQAGMFKNTLNDLRLLWMDLRAVLGDPREQNDI